jgi:LmbE family N-acetylglucosaminyl deacetylase
MRIWPLVLLAPLFGSAPTFAVPVLTYEGTTLVVAQVTPGASIAVAGLRDSGSSLLIHTGQYRDDDGDGAVTGIEPLAAGTPHLTTLRQGDVVAMIDPSNFQLSTGRVKAASFPDTIGFESAAVTVAEGGEAARLLVTRHGQGLPAASVEYRAPGSSPATLTWPAGDASPREIRVPIENNLQRDPDRILDVALLHATGAFVRQPADARITVVDDEAPRESRLNGPQVACDANRAEGLLHRLGLTAEGAADSQLALWFTPTGDLAGLAAADGSGGIERQLAFSSNLEESTLLRNPVRPQLFSVSLTRNDLDSDLVAAGAPGRLAVTLNPTLAESPAAESLLVIDNVGGVAGATGTGGRPTDAKPGRGLAELAEPCERTASARNAHDFALLAKVVRARAQGASRFEIAILRGEAVDAYYLDVYPLGADGRPLGRLALALDVTHAADGSLDRGTLRVLPRCDDPAAGPVSGPHCTSVAGPAGLRLVVPKAAGASQTAAVEVGTDGERISAFAWSTLLGGTTWASSPAQNPPPLPRETGGAAATRCDQARLRGFLDRLSVASPGAHAAVNLGFTASGDFTGLAFTAGGPRPERHLAFSTNPEEMTLLRNPLRPQLDSVSLTRNALGSDLLGAADPGRLRLTLNPTLAPDPAPASLLILDNVVEPAGSATSSRPGRGIADLLERCHSGFTPRQSHVTQVLAQLFRAEVEGAAMVKTAIFSGSDSSYGFIVYPFSADGTSMGRIGVSLSIEFDPATGGLASGRLRFVQSCPDEACTDFHGHASVGLIRPAAAGSPAQPGPYQLSRDDIQATVDVDFRDLLRGSTWSRPLPAAGRSLAQRIALGGSVLWIGAHPDDEVLASPLLGEVCVELGARCSFLVATRGERGVCELPGGCSPDVATVRTQEMEAAAALYGGRLVQGDLPDGAGDDPDSVLQAWAQATPGGLRALQDRLRGAIADLAPATIVTFDPRHGSTCHPDHRAITSLLASLARVAGPFPDVYWLETRLRFEGGNPGDFTVAVRGDPAVRILDARPYWSYLLRDAAAHPSQITPSQLDILRAAPDASRIVPLLLSRDSLPGLGYEDLCQ